MWNLSLKGGVFTICTNIWRRGKLTTKETAVFSVERPGNAETVNLDEIRAFGLERPKGERTVNLDEIHDFVSTRYLTASEANLAPSHRVSNVV